MDPEKTLRRSPRLEFLIVALLIGIAFVRIVGTYLVFCQTFDEPAHLAAGLEWLDRGSYLLLPYNPPLARVSMALLPYLDGARFRPMGGFGGMPANAIASGNATLATADYWRVLTLARLGNLPFFFLATALVALWARWLGGPTAGIAAAFLFTTLPIVLAHGALATTDMAAAATVTAAVLTFWRWLAKPRIGTSVLLGCCLAAAVVTKFSALLFLPPAALVILVIHTASSRSGLWKQYAVMAPGVLLVAAVSIWAVYRFHTVEWQRVDEVVRGHSPFLPALHAFSHLRLPLPAPELIAGVDMLEADNRASHYPSYLFGHVDTHGHALFFPTLLSIKTPLPFLVLWLSAIPLLWPLAHRERLVMLGPLLVSGAILLSSFAIHVQGGLRILLPIFPAAAVAAGLATVEWWRRSRSALARAALIALLGAQLAVVSLAHPDYLPYFNTLAGQHPEEIAADSDLDWGQDLPRLTAVVREMGIHDLSIAYFGSANPWQLVSGATLRNLPPGERRHGWIAVSETYVLPIWTSGYRWLLDYKPVRRVGKSMYLYLVPTR